MNRGKTRFVADPASCAKCGADEWSEITHSDTVDVRGLLVNVEGLRLNQCSRCKHHWVSSEQRQHNEEVTRAAFVETRNEVRRREGLLEGGDIERVRQRFSLSQREASHIFGGGMNSFNKYESGEVLQSQAMDNLLRLTYRFGDMAIEFVKNCRGSALNAAPKLLALDEVIAGSHYVLGSSIKANRADTPALREGAKSFQMENWLESSALEIQGLNQLQETPRV